LVTPRIHTGVLGTVVTASYSTISVTFTILIAYSSAAVIKVRYCTAFTGSWFLPGLEAELEVWFEAWLGACCDAPIISLLTILPFCIVKCPTDAVVKLVHPTAPDSSA
jgi:hypothetical protein